MEHRIEICPITMENAEVLALPNEPFRCEGRLIPLYDGKNWSYRIEMFEAGQVKEECFPDENYQLEEMGEDFCGLAACVDGTYAGYLLAYKQWNRFLYVDNLLVKSEYRRLGVASRLIEECMRLAMEMDQLGI